MKSISGPLIPQLVNTTPQSSNINYWINYLLYNESKINIWNISANTNVGSYEKVVVPLGKIANTQ